MHISLENPEHHAVQAYSDNEIKINSIIYSKSLIVSKQEIITEVEIHSIHTMDKAYLELFLKYKPEVIIIGHPETGTLPPITILAQLSQLGIGMECMSIGAACRTYNVLLSEERSVVAGIILK
jgi:uncharacterized protein